MSEVYAVVLLSQSDCSSERGRLLETNGKLMVPELNFLIKSEFFNLSGVETVTPRVGAAAAIKLPVTRCLA